MKNKQKFKKTLIYILIFFIIFLILFIIINRYQYKNYIINTNRKISGIVSKLEEFYPYLNEQDIIETLNSEYDYEGSIFKKYGIDIDNDSIILKNNKVYNKFLMINIMLIVISFLTLIYIFIKYNTQKDKELNKITKYIKEINKRNYSLKIDELSEDELSILKNEIYKTTVMLKESAINSLNDKKNLKNSLVDISHQLKTPLTSILVMLDNLIDDPNMDNNIKEEFILDIKREVVNINFLVQSLLKLSKFDANTIIFKKENVLVKDVLKETIKNLTYLCDLKNIKINVIGDNDIFINADFKWQVEAITNIVKNSIEHSNINTNITITYEKNNVYTNIIIEDNGCGISNKDLPHIFKRFYKSENSLDDSVGVGLALAKSIIEKDNGSIYVKSSKKGTIFEIKYFNV